MKTQMRIAAIIGLLIIALPNGCDAQDLGCPSGTLVMRKLASVKTDSVEVDLQIPKVSTPDYCLLQVELKNIGDVNIQVDELKGIPSCTLALKSPDGRLCPHSHFAYDLLVQFDKLHNGSAALNVIEKGATRTWYIPLDRYFLVTPGSWTLEFSLGMMGGPFFAVKDLPISIFRETVWNLSMPSPGS